MIKITLDEAYVFDLLSIYEVKIKKSSGSKKTKLTESFFILKGEIINQIGQYKYDEVVSSTQYEELKLCNEKVFDLVDRANETELSKLTADANYDRYVKKMMLQNTFFQEKLSEVKI